MVAPMIAALHEQSDFLIVRKLLCKRNGKQECVFSTHSMLLVITDLRHPLKIIDRWRQIYFTFNSGKPFLFIGLHFTYKNFKMRRSEKKITGIKLSISLDKLQRNDTILF